jgi:WD40 repeat protein/predicted Ser/Thr protein kinase
MTDPAPNPDTIPPDATRPGGPDADLIDLLDQAGKLDRLEWLALLRADQARRWQGGQRLPAEAYLAQLPPLRADGETALDLIYSEVLLRERLGESPGVDEYVRRFPQFADQLRTQFELHRGLAASGDGPAYTDPYATRPPAEATASSPDGLGSGTLPLGPRPDIGEVAVPGYEVLGVLGRGGMGIVYKARQDGLNRLVALKMIQPAGTGPDDLARFRREAEAAAQLQHPNIVQVHAVGQCQGRPYFSLEYVEGGSLAQKAAGGPLPPEQAARLVETVARAAHAAHQRGIVHRDLKPANILLTADGVPKIADFGLAKRLDVPADQTQPGLILGTPSYMAPEQAQGHSHDLGPAADVYALGTILYELLTGRPPFQAATVLVLLEQVRAQEPVPPTRLQPRLPRDLETVCLKCLEKETHRRYASALDLADDLRRFLTGEPIRARPAGAWERAVKWARRRPAVAALAAAVVLVAALGFALVTWQWRRAESASRTAADRADAEARARRDAVAALGQAEANLYLHLLASAQREWFVGRDVRRARGLLDECPPGRRGWEWHYLRRLFEGGRLTLRGHQAPVTCVAFAPDGRLASGGEDGTVRVWDAGGNEVRSLRPAGRPLRVLFSGDGRRLAALSGPGRQVLQVWDPATGQEEFTLRDAGAWVALSPDGRRLAAGTNGGAVTVWDLTTGREAFTLRGPTLPVLGAAFSPDGGCLACACGTPGDDRAAVLGVEGDGAAGPKRGGPGQAPPRDQKPGEVRLYDARTGAEVRTLRGHRAPVLGVAFSPDGRELASASWDQTVKVWDPTTGKELHTLAGHADAVRGVAFTPVGGRLLAFGGDQGVQVWDPATGREVLRLKGTVGSPVRSAVSPDGQALAAADAGGEQPGEVTVWDLAAGKPLRTFRGHVGPVRDLAFSADGSALASAGDDGSVKVWDVLADPEAHTLAAGESGLAFSPDGRCLASGSDDTAVKLWDARTGKELGTLSGHSAGVEAAAFSPDGRLLATAARDFGEPGEVKLWDVGAGKEVLTLPGQPGVGSLAFSPDGRRLAVPGEDNSVGVWDPAAGRRLLVLRGPTAWVSAVAFAPDGRRLAAASWDGSVTVWDGASGRAVLTLRGHPEGANGVAYSRDGRRLASAGKGPGGTVAVWDADTGQELLRLRGEAGAACVAFHPDGRRLVSGGVNGAAQVWDAVTGQELLTLQGHRGAVTAVLFSPDGQRLATAGANGVVRVWDGAPHQESGR